jgi:hypothetical protein
MLDATGFGLRLFAFREILDPERGGIYVVHKFQGRAVVLGIALSCSKPVGCETVWPPGIALLA